MSSFKKTHAKNYAQVCSFINTDSQYWKNFEFPITVKEYSSIDYIDISPVEPYYIAVTTGPKVDIYHQQSAQIWQSLTRFQRNAYGGCFRNDGKLLVAGSEEAQIKLFNYRQKQLLRVFKGHNGPVHRACFIHGKPQLASFSDDKSVCLWDIADEKQICKLEEHTDFIRAGVASPTSEHILLSGSYDHSIKMWDTRTGSSVMNVDHGAPVSSLLCYASGSVFASTGGTEIRIWDAVAGKLLSILSQHHKTITCLSLATKNSRLLSGSLDGHLKVYDINTYSTLHTLDYPAPILCMGIAPGDSTIVTGMLSKGPNPMAGGTGLISFEHKKDLEKSKEMSKRKAENVRNLPVEEFKVLPGDEVVTFIEREKLTKYDTMLRKFQFSRALDVVMQRGTASNSPHISVAIFRELIRRGALASALAGRDIKFLAQVFKFLTKNIRNSAYHKILSEVAHTLLDVYGDEFASDNRLNTMLMRLNDELEKDIIITKGGIDLLGVLDMFTTVSSCRTEAQREDMPRIVPLTTSNRSNALSSQPSEPSEDAQNYKVVVDIG